jgi:hypothetical protein
MSIFKGWMIRVVLLLVPVALLAVAIPHLIDGLAVEAAYPAPLYLAMNEPQSLEAYTDAANSLDFGMRADGDRLIDEGEIISLAGGKRGRVVDMVADGLTRSPASARGWAVLAEQTLPADRQKAAKDVGIALELAPSNFLLSGRLLADAGAVWDLLPKDSQQVAVNIAPNLWVEPSLRRYLRPVLRSSGGVQLLTEAFHDSPEDLRALNRFVAEQRLKDESQP